MQCKTAASNCLLFASAPFSPTPPPLPAKPRKTPQNTTPPQLFTSSKPRGARAFTPHAPRPARLGAQGLARLHEVLGLRRRREERRHADRLLHGLAGSRVRGTRGPVSYLAGQCVIILTDNISYSYNISIYRGWGGIRGCCERRRGAADFKIRRCVCVFFLARDGWCHHGGVIS